MVSNNRFSAGESNIVFTGDLESACIVTVTWNYKDDGGFMRLMLLCDILCRKNPNCELRLDMPYFPHARMDRATTPDTPFSLLGACEVINVCKFETITTLDLHSPVAFDLIDARLVSKIPELNLTEYTNIIAPDKGAIERCKQFKFIHNHLNIVILNKVRDPATGDIGGIELVDPNAVINGRSIIVDDICDGGRTFIEAAKVLPCSKTDLDLHVTHGIFSKGFSQLNEYFNQVSCTRLVLDESKNEFEVTYE